MNATAAPTTATFFAYKARARKAERLAEIVKDAGGNAWSVEHAAVRADAYAVYKNEVPGATVPSSSTWGQVSAMLAS